MAVTQKKLHSPVLGVASLSNSVYAAEGEQADEEELMVEEIIVTGSRIVRKELVSENPVQILTNADIEATGLNNLVDVLMNITASDGTGLRSVTTATYGSDGSQQARCSSDNVPPGGAPQPTSQLRTLGGGNPFLGSEQGENWTAGFVWTPEFADGLDILLDWWKVSLQDAQSTFGSSYILNQCYREGVDGFCNFVERDAVGQIDVVRTASFNAAERQVSGIDFGIRYLMDTDKAGTFQFTWNTTWTDYDKTKVGDDDEWDDAVGIYQGATAWEWRSYFVTQWAYKDFVTTWTMRYMSKLEEDCWLHYYGIGDIDPDSPTYNPIMCSDPTKTNIYDDTGVNYLAATLYNDLQVAWSVPWGAVITAGGRNIFGHAPPKTQNSFAHSFDGAYDLPGGPFWYVSYRHDF